MTEDYKKQVKDAKQDRERKLVLKHKYENRITQARLGKEAFAAGDYVTAIRKYTDYFETLSELHSCGSIFELRPEHFRKDKDLTETMMISHLYFELARVYDATGKFQEECGKCLDQFVVFTANQPYQVVNSEMARKHLRKYRFRNHDKFFHAYQQIFVQSRKCFIATLCLGENHPGTERLRGFKRWLMLTPGGMAFVRSYYLVSSALTDWMQAHPRVRDIFTNAMKPVLLWLSRALPSIGSP